MLKTGIPAQWVQKQLDDLCIATPPAKRDVMEDFIKTHRDTCARVGVRLAPEIDNDKAFSCETSGTILGVQYDAVTWSWNIDCEKVQIILHMLYDMAEAESVKQCQYVVKLSTTPHYLLVANGGKDH